MNPKEPISTFLLFSEPSFLEGYSRAFDLGNTLTYYNYSETDQRADFDAFYRDWLAVGSDIHFALKKHGELTETSRLTR